MPAHSQSPLLRSTSQISLSIKLHCLATFFPLQIRSMTNDLIRTLWLTVHLVSNFVRTRLRSGSVSIVFYCASRQGVVAHVQTVTSRIDSTYCTRVQRNMSSPRKRTQLKENIPTCLRYRVMPQHSRQSQAAIVSLPSSTSAAWRLRSFQSEKQLFLHFRHAVSQERHQTKPLFLRHILFVLRVTLEAGNVILKRSLLYEQCVQLLAILIEFGSTLYSFTRDTRLVESLCDCTLRHAELAWDLGHFDLERIFDVMLHRMLSNLVLRGNLEDWQHQFTWTWRWSHLSTEESDTPSSGSISFLYFLKCCSPTTFSIGIQSSPAKSWSSVLSTKPCCVRFPKCLPHLGVSTCTEFVLSTGSVSQRAPKWNWQQTIQEHRGLKNGQHCGSHKSLQRSGCDSQYLRECVMTRPCSQVPGLRIPRIPRKKFQQFTNFVKKFREVASAHDPLCVDAENRLRASWSFNRHHNFICELLHLGFVELVLDSRSVISYSIVWSSEFNCVEDSDASIDAVLMISLSQPISRRHTIWFSTWDRHRGNPEGDELGQSRVALCQSKSAKPRLQIALLAQNLRERLTRQKEQNVLFWAGVRWRVVAITDSHLRGVHVERVVFVRGVRAMHERVHANDGCKSKKKKTTSNFLLTQRETLLAWVLKPKKEIHAGFCWCVQMLEKYRRGLCTVCWQ